MFAEVDLACRAYMVSLDHDAFGHCASNQQCESCACPCKFGVFQRWKVGQEGSQALCDMTWGLCGSSSCRKSGIHKTTRADGSGVREPFEGDIKEARGD